MFKSLSKSTLPVLVVLLIVACVPYWRSGLSWLDQSKWTRHDRLAFLMKSPWTKFAKAEIKGLAIDSGVSLEIRANWLSGYFDSTRRDVVKAAEQELPFLLEFNPNMNESRFLYGEKFLVAEIPPVPLTHKVLVVNSRFESYAGFWPTGLEAAQMAYKSLNISPPPKTVIQYDLDNHVDNNQYVVIELSIVPIVENRDFAGDDFIALRECLSSITGQLIMRGAVLEKNDKDTIGSVKSLILSNDINGLWDKQAFSADAEKEVVLSPKVVRILFPRKKQGQSWLAENERNVRLILKLPEDMKNYCAKDDTKGISVETSFMFDLVDMQVVGPMGL